MNYAPVSSYIFAYRSRTSYRFSLEMDAKKLSQRIASICQEQRVYILITDDSQRPSGKDIDLRTGVFPGGDCCTGSFANGSGSLALQFNWDIKLRCFTYLILSSE